MDKKVRIPNGMTAIQMAVQAKKERKESKKISMIARGFMKGDMMVEVSDPGQWEFQCDYYKLPEIKKGVSINPFRTPAII